MSYAEVFWRIHHSIGKPSILTSTDSRINLAFYHLHLKSGIASVQFMDSPAKRRMEMMLMYTRGFHPIATVMQALTLRPPSPSNMQLPAYVRAFSAPHYFVSAMQLPADTRKEDVAILNNKQYELADEDDADIIADEQCEHTETIPQVRSVFDAFITALREQSHQINTPRPCTIGELTFVSEYGDAVCIGNNVQWYTTLKGRVRLLIRFPYDEVPPMSEAQFRAFVTALLFPP
jgi:hypothetical protein